MNDRAPVDLRRSVNPYVGQVVILAVVTLGAAFVTIERHDWVFLLSIVAIVWGSFSFVIYVGLKYRISYTDKEVCQDASGGRRICIAYSAITTLRLEVSSAGEIAAQKRPFRRIAIYEGDRDDDGRFIDVSLKHFVAEDIRRLMRTIHARRPDLLLPKHWA